MLNGTLLLPYALFVGELTVILNWGVVAISKNHVSSEFLPAISVILTVALCFPKLKSIVGINQTIASNVSAGAMLLASGEPLLRFQQV